MANGDQTPVTHTFLHNKMEQVREIMGNEFKGINNSFVQYRKSNNSSHEHIRKDIGDLRDREQEHTSEISKMRVDLSGMKTDLSWLKKTYWIIAAASIGSALAAIFNLFQVKI